MMQRTLATSFLLLNLIITPLVRAQGQAPPLTVAKIMQDPDTWIGGTPSQPFWAEDGETLYFRWNPQGQFPVDSLYSVPREGGTPTLVEPIRRRALGPTFDGWHHGEYVYDRTFRRKVYDQDGDLYVYDRDGASLRRLTNTRARESNPRFSRDGRAIIFERDDNLFRLDPSTGSIVQVTDLRAGQEEQEQEADDQARYLREQQLNLFDYLREQQEEEESREAARERDRMATDPPPTYYVGSKNIQQLQLDPNGRFVSFVLSERPNDPRPTQLINYVTETGYAEELDARPKVGSPPVSTAFYVQDLERDTTYQINLHQLTGTYDVPAYRREQGIEIDSSKTKRDLFTYGPYWSGDGQYAVLEVRAADNKDRWITRLDAVTGDLTLLDRQHDDAWIAGPGISWFGGRSTMGWLPDDRHFYFQSERTGYSHLYTVDVKTGDLEQLTRGTFEIFSPQLSRDGRTWYFTSSEVSPFERHFYRMPVDGGPRTRLTSMEGNNQVALSPDAERMAIHYSFTNQPPEVYLKETPQEGVSGNDVRYLPRPERITKSTTAAWEAYDWRVPEIITFEASDGVDVPAHIFRPENPNGAAVLFVHGAGYLQNVHRWWSSYFREYMFHNLLADLGYTVLNVDYRASAGYGRDWRTAIYRHMGGRDLGDYIDASEYVARMYDIGPEQQFIYGGSYGGFMALMALFTAPEHFGGGAALRSVTDWAHYNHPYTANILNTPALDSLAFARSSPINFADGLEDPLLMAHGLLDTNVQPQDIIRLTQRLIELGKEDWELAVYPVEGHGFTEPSSWTDEYRRILELIKLSVGPREAAMEEVPVLQGDSR